MDINQAKELLQRYQSGSCTTSENDLVESWYQQLIDTGEWQWGAGEKELKQQILEARIMKQIDNMPEKVKSIVSFSLSFRWWAAASVILLLGAFSYFKFFDKTTTITPNLNPVAIVLPDDIKAPESNRAMITLANGKNIYLDSAGNGLLALQGNVKLVKLAEDEIAYQQETGNISGEMEYNTLSNPNGSNVINVVLTDGSKVWLNAGSSLTYLVSFIGNERKVSVKGEAYFEVSGSLSEEGKKRRFIVENSNMQIEVLGTHFNVNTFGDDGDNSKVTLLEGSVKINNGHEKGLLKPGQQAWVNKKVKILNDVDLNRVMAWKNGYFQFDNASLQNVLKQVSRWYAIDVVYDGQNQQRKFIGEIQKDLSLSEMLKILEKNKVHFKIEGKRLRVLPD
ncbi:MAG: FecR domain-containing protein [Ginsengibacter sp.]